MYRCGPGPENECDRPSFQKDPSNAIFSDPGPAPEFHTPSTDIRDRRPTACVSETWSVPGWVRTLVAAVNEVQSRVND
jgi:hypothetical protein